MGHERIELERCLLLMKCNRCTHRGTFESKEKKFRIFKDDRLYTFAIKIQLSF